MPDHNQSLLQAAQCLNHPYGVQQLNQLSAASCWTPITVRLDDDTVSRIADAVIAKLRNAAFIEPADA